MGEVKQLWLWQSWGSVSNLWTPCTPCSRCSWTGFCTLTPRELMLFSGAWLCCWAGMAYSKKKKKKGVLGSQLLLQSLSLMLCLNMYADAFLRSCRLLTAGLRPETNPPNSPVSFLTIRYPVFTFLMPWGRSLKRPEKHDLLFSWYFHHTSTMGRFCLGFPYMLRKNKTTTENKIKMWISHIRPHN